MHRKLRDSHSLPNLAMFKLKDLVEWVKGIWIDILTMLAIGGVTLGLYLGPNLDLRRFPTYFPGSQPLEVIYPELAYPYRPPGWILRPWIAGLLSAGLPVLAILLAQVRVRSLWDLTNGVLGALYAILLAATMHMFLKTLIGGYRPYFLDVCDPLLPSDDLQGKGFGNLYFSTDICQTDDEGLLKEAMSSFPSGHAAVAFAGLGFLSLYLNGKLKAWGNRRAQAWIIFAVLVPVGGAALIACSVLVDNAHHPHDVVVGILIGVLSCFATYRMYYAAVWDWRFNHVPLRPGKDFSYDLKEAMCDEVLIKRRDYWADSMAGSQQGHGDEGRRRTPVGDQMV